MTSSLLCTGDPYPGTFSFPIWPGSSNLSCHSVQGILPLLLGNDQSVFISLEPLGRHDDLNFKLLINVTSFTVSYKTMEKIISQQ